MTNSPPTFRLTGYGFYSFRTTGGELLTTAEPIDAARQADGRIVLLASVSRPSPDLLDLALLRIHPDGSLDTTFGDGGYRYLDLDARRAVDPAGGGFDRPRALAIQPDGRIVVVADTEPVVERVYSHPDPAIGTVYDLIVPMMAVARFEADGRIDESFGDGGSLLLAMRRQPFLGGVYTQVNPSAARDVVVQPDGGLLIVGQEGFAGTYGDAALVRLLPGGALDPGFGGYADWTGDNARLPGASFLKQTTAQAAGRDFTGSGDSFERVVLGPDGEIYAAGTTWWGSSATDFFIAKFQPDGLPDAGFGNGGRVRIDIGNGTVDTVNALLLQADGHVLAAGSTSGPDGALAVVRLRPDGSRDTGFSGDGVATFTTWYLQRGYSDGGAVRTLLPQADGSTLVLAEGYDARTGSEANVLLARLRNDGTLDPAFGDQGRVYLDSRNPANLAGDWALGVPVLALPHDDLRVSILMRKFSTGATYDGAASLMRVLEDNGRVDQGFMPQPTLPSDAFVPWAEWDPVATAPAPATQIAPVMRVWDAERALTNDFGGAVLELARAGGPRASDAFDAAEGYGLTPLVEGQSFGRIYEPVAATIGHVEKNSDGLLRIRFAEGATEALVNATLTAIGYRYQGPQPPHTLSEQPGRISLTWTFFDGDPAAPSTLAAQATTQMVVARTDRDTQRPVLTDLVPAGGALDLPIDLRTVVLSFSETVRLGEPPITLSLVSPATGASTVVASSATPGQVLAQGNTVTVSLAADLLPNSLYRLSYGVGSVTDMAGNVWDSIYPFDFRTGTATQGTGGSTGPGSAASLRVEGPIVGAAAYRDGNGDGRADATEAIGLSTDEQGRLGVTPAGSSALLLLGGTHTGMDVANALILAAPVQASVVSPLTTVVHALMRSAGRSADAASSTIASALGLAGVDLLRHDPWSASTDATSLAVIKASAQTGLAMAVAGRQFASALAAAADARPADQVLDLGAPQTLTALAPWLPTDTLQALAQASAGVAMATQAAAVIASQREGLISLERAGTSGNDLLASGTGDDRLDGGAGLDTVRLPYPAARALRETAHDGLRIQDSGLQFGDDTLVAIERLHFSDLKFALDTAPGQNAARTAQFISLLAPSALQAPAVAGTVLGLVDAGTGLEGLFQLAIDIGLVQALAGSDAPGDIARLAYRNVAGVEPGAPMLDLLISFMDGRVASFTPARFLTEIAQLEAAVQVALAGISPDGLAFL